MYIYIYIYIYIHFQDYLIIVSPCSQADIDGCFIIHNTDCNNSILIVQEQLDGSHTSGGKPQWIYCKNNINFSKDNIFNDYFYLMAKFCRQWVKSGNYFLSTLAFYPLALPHYAFPHSRFLQIYLIPPAWSGHIHNVICKTNRTLGLLRRNLWNCKLDVRETAYKCLILS